MTSNQQPGRKIIRSFEDLEVWQEAHKLTLEIYKITRKFPKGEQYGLASQLKRSASSIAANIAEGHSRDTTKEFVKFLFNARGSIAETESHLVLARDLKYITEGEFQGLRKRYKVLGKRTNALISSLKRKSGY